MKVSSVSFYNNFVINSPNKKSQNKNCSVNYSTPVNFGMRIDYGTPAKLAEPLQNKISNIHENLDLIQNFFLSFSTKNPQLSAKVKKGYTDLIPKRQSGIVFKLPDTENTIEVMRSQTRKNILYISIDNQSPEYNGIVIDGKDKLVANYLKRHPHMLPREIKHMNEERLKEAQPEKYINLADKKIQGYGDYIRKLQSGEIPMPKVEQSPARKAWLEGVKKGEITPHQTKEKQIAKTLTTTTTTVEENTEKNNSTKFIDRNPETKKKHIQKTPKLTNTEFGEYMAEKSKNIIKKISNLLTTDTKELPEHITPKLAPNGKALGFSLKTDDGGTLKVTRKAIASYGNSMPYLSFEKINSDNSMNFISIDMISNKILRTKEKGKPHISSDHIVYELTPDELKKRKIEDKLDYYMGQIFKEPANQETPIEPPVLQPKKTNKINNSKIKEPTKTTPKIDTNLEKLKDDMRMQGKKDGSIAATEYFNAFKEQFLTDLQSKMSAFNENLHKLFENIG